MATATRRIRGEQIDADQAYEYWLDSPIWGTKRPSKNDSDFGDTQTVGKHLKRSGLTFHQFEDNLDFGLYLGEHKGKWVVGIKNEDGSKLAGGEVFDSLSDLKQAWILD
jgi:hypothetical protein